jgi:hypothetical protein
MTAVEMRCPRCWAPTIATPDGRLLEPRADLGTWRPDGTQLTTTDVLRGQRGHHPHECHTTAPTGQDALPLTDTQAGGAGQ